MLQAHLWFGTEFHLKLRKLNLCLSVSTVHQTTKEHQPHLVGAACQWLNLHKFWDTVSTLSGLLCSW